jgi:hypothetical protein
MTLAQKMHTAIRSPGIQYLIGVLINLVYIIILISDQTSYQNIQVPENNYSENLWKGTDVLTYVRPAQNFVDHRIFGSGTIPDYRRSIGYPLFLSTLMMIFGRHWIIFTLFMQALIFAVMYPLLSRISNILFNTSGRTVIFAFLFFIFSGTYIVMVPMILTDTFFTLFFTLGLWLGLESIIKRNYIYLLLHIIFIGYAAQVRPSLSLYPIINYLILISIAMKYGLTRCTRIYQIVMTSFVSLLIICNLSSIRNYMNYNFFKPTDILAVGLLDLGNYVLVEVGKSDGYEEIQKTLQGIKDPKAKMRLQEELAVKIFKDYPIITLKQIMHNAIGILGRAHWPEVAAFWGYSFLDNFSPEYMPQKKSTAVYHIEIFFNFIYLFVYFLCLGFFIRVFRSENIVFSLTIVLFITYLLIPTFIMRGGGSRYRLPVEGLIVIMASCEFEHHIEALNGKLFRLIDRIYTLVTQR